MSLNNSSLRICVVLCCYTISSHKSIQRQNTFSLSFFNTNAHAFLFWHLFLANFSFLYLDRIKQTPEPVADWQCQVDETILRWPSVATQKKTLGSSPSAIAEKGRIQTIFWWHHRSVSSYKRRLQRTRSGCWRCYSRRVLRFSPRKILFVCYKLLHLEYILLEFCVVHSRFVWRGLANVV